MTGGTSDPTIQSPRAPAADATGHWQVSLAEIDAMGRKAARGAGLAWGLAEEAGRAARWLAAHGQPGPEALLAALEAMEGDPPAHAPDADWRAAAALCPVRTGAAFCDRMALGPVRLGPMIEPLLLVPFLCRAARASGAAFALRGESIRLVATPAGPVCDGWKALRQTARLTLEPSAAEGQSRAAGPGPGPWRVDVETWRRLERLARRTYVPASKASRAGAGAGTGPEAD